ncbi:MAG TPA: hypothetical protein VH419_05560 [Nocardioidaceae bacterium]
MLNQLHQPKGAVGIFSVVATLILALWGAFVIVAMLLWDDEEMTRGDEVMLVVFGAIMIVGAIGFVIMARRPWLGATLAVVGSIALGVILFWTIVPMILGATFIIVALVRAQAFASHNVPA